MAATIAKCRGVDKSGRVKEASRLGGGYAEGEANTWRTFATVTTYADGSGHVEVTRDGEVLHKFAWGSENMNG